MPDQQDRRQAPDQDINNKTTRYPFKADAPANSFFPRHSAKQDEKTKKTEGNMRKFFIFLALIAWSFALFASETRGKFAFDPAKPQTVSDTKSEAAFYNYFKAEVGKGTFVLKSTDLHPLTGIEHSRSDQVYW